MVNVMDVNVCVPWFNGQIGELFVGAELAKSVKVHLLLGHHHHVLREVVVNQKGLQGVVGRLGERVVGGWVVGGRVSGWLLVTHTSSIH